MLQAPILVSHNGPLSQFSAPTIGEQTTVQSVRASAVANKSPLEYSQLSAYCRARSFLESLPQPAVLGVTPCAH